MYQSAGAAGPNGFETEAEEQPTEEDEATVEGEFREVGD
jgi:hypothetical protein